MFGEEGGWSYMDSLHENIARYTHSGSKPCKLAAAGEIPIGISFAFRGAKSKAQGAPLEIIIPSEGIGWDMEATAIVKGTDKLEAAKTLVDWSVSEKANKMYNEGYAVVAIPGLAWLFAAPSRCGRRGARTPASRQREQEEVDHSKPGE